MRIVNLEHDEDEIILLEKGNNTVIVNYKPFQIHVCNCDACFNAVDLYDCFGDIITKEEYFCFVVVKINKTCNLSKTNNLVYI